ncbi:hypothetical protein CRYUN_Cryun37aG0010300 [Craigia yunnanensis]
MNDGAAIPLMDENRRMGLVGEEFLESSLKLICCEEIDGRRWKYVAEKDPFGNSKNNSIRALCLHSPQAPLVELMSFARSYVVPEGFSDSVIPSYMTWRVLKLRFAGDLLMELGAGVELATAAVPHLFLPLACSANVAKVELMLVPITSTSTRTLIYKAFAKGENIGDVTAKGECVGNIADLVRSVVLHTLNRARFSVAVDSFLKTGKVPSLQEGNMQENIFNFSWLKDRSVVLGSRFGDAFQDPGADLAKERYIVTYNPSKGKVYALLKDQAKSDDILKAAFYAHVLLHFIHLSNNSQSSSRSQQEHGHSNLMPTTTDFEPHIADSCKMVSTSYGLFKNKAAEQVELDCVNGLIGINRLVRNWVLSCKPISDHRILSIDNNGKSIYIKRGSEIRMGAYTNGTMGTMGLFELAKAVGLRYTLDYSLMVGPALLAKIKNWSSALQP